MYRKGILMFLLAGLLLLASCRLDKQIAQAPLNTPTIEPACEWPCAGDLAAMTAEMALTLNWSKGLDITPTPTWITGDLGWGQIAGKVVDVNNGAPVAGAKVTCRHTSYTSSMPCSGSVLTRPDGGFVFANIFFHDTDTIILLVDAPGFVSQVFRQDFFTQPRLQVTVSLPPVGWTPDTACALPACAPNEALLCLGGSCSGNCGYSCVIATISATAPMPLIMCTAPACPGGVLACGDADGCPGGCGTVCLTPTP